MYLPDMSRYEGVPENKLPKFWFPFYVVFKYNWWKSTYIVGFETDIEADAFQNEMLNKKDLERCEIFGHYPRNLLEG